MPNVIRLPLSVTILKFFVNLVSFDQIKIS